MASGSRSYPRIAWGVTGHRAIGAVAERLLNKKAKLRIQAILGYERLPLATTWMDEIRSDSTYNHTADWHWVTIETGKTYDQMSKNPKGDVIQTLERLISELKQGKVSGRQELEHLKMILHLVGDIHQPLHVGCCDDQGGNKVRLKWFREDSNLHRLWDSDLIDHTRLSYTELADALPIPGEAAIRKIQGASVRDWATENMKVRDRVYLIGDGKLGYEYAYRNMELVNQRLLYAGIRLAGILNAIYGI
ncbi:MAG: S1/P1 nuclease [Bacteroidota bacterium]